MSGRGTREDSDLDVGLTTGALRAILAMPGTRAGRAEDLARRLGDAIRVGLILDGERLPSEARLSAQLGIASVTLREVLRLLRGDGLIATRRGHGGGTIVTAPADQAASLATRLDRLALLDIRDLGDHRFAVFSAAAELAAGRALPIDIAHLRAHVARLGAGRNAGELRRADSLFTVEMAVAAQSPRLAREDLRLRVEVGDLLWMHPRDEEIDRAVALRTDLVDAVASRDGAAARSLAAAVIDEDTRRLVSSRLTSYATGLTPRTVPSHPLDALRLGMQRIVTSLQELAGAFAGLAEAQAPEEPIRRKDLAALRPQIERVLEDNPELLIGAGLAVRPGLLADADRWLEWLWTSDGARPEPLRINLDPAAPDFYDYATAEWFEHPCTTGRAEVTGPYVDASCTGEYVLTMSAPVYLGGVFIGMVAADVSVAVVESIVVRQADMFGGPLVVVSRDHRVLLSTDERHLPGELLESGPGRGDHVLVFGDTKPETNS